MSGEYRTVDFGAAHLGAAGRLLAARHRTERQRFPLLPARFEDPPAAADVVRAAMGYAEGVAAVDRRGDLAGFLFAFRNMVDAASGSARYAPSRSSMLLAHGHAVEPGHDAYDVYHTLLAELAERLRRDEIFEHFAHVPAGDANVLDAWYSLGFGKANAVAIRGPRPIEGGRAGSVEIREATPEDIDVVQRLVDEEARFHATSPIFRPYVAEQTRDTVRASLLDALNGDESVHLIATAGGEEAGIIEIGPGRGSPLYIPDGGAYIGDTAVFPAHRGSGVGAALVDAGLAWARDRGYLAVSLHFTITNALSSSFWTGLGFEVAMWHLHRRLDPRIATNRP